MAMAMKLDHGGAIDTTINEIEHATAFLIDVQDHITLAQFRRLKLARHALADFLVTALKVDADPKPTAAVS